ncbi:hypothetical protein SNEBB_006079 [Seison nebaliae]|nr:hypothetical protein SNEBB_006079 [Seison nebaliae]
MSFKGLDGSITLIENDKKLRKKKKSDGGRVRKKKISEKKIPRINLPILPKKHLEINDEKNISDPIEFVYGDKKTIKEKEDNGKLRRSLRQSNHKKRKTEENIIDEEKKITYLLNDKRKTKKGKIPLSPLSSSSPYSSETYIDKDGKSVVKRHKKILDCSFIPSNPLDDSVIELNKKDDELLSKKKRITIVPSERKLSNSSTISIASIPSIGHNEITFRKSNHLLSTRESIFSIGRSIQSKLSLKQIESIIVDEPIEPSHQERIDKFSYKFHNDIDLTQPSSRCLLQSHSSTLSNVTGVLEDIHGTCLISTNSISIGNRTNSETNQLLIEEENEKKLLDICKQKQIIDFSNCHLLSKRNTIEKIGEGSYGEVFFSNNQVMKILPINGVDPTTLFAFPSIEKVLIELMVNKRLEMLKDNSNFYCNSFITLERAEIVSGYFPNRLLAAWNRFKKTNPKDAINTVPGIDKDQQYLTIYFEHGGVELEKFKFDVVEEAYSLIAQTALSLAAAEQFCQFEHRDLHQSNILIQKSSTSGNEKKFKINNETYMLECCAGIKVNIIDYTLSRITLENHQKIFHDLADETGMFEESPCSAQLEAYQQTRKFLSNKWASYEPKTNVIWLQYVTKIIQQKIGRRRNKFIQLKQFLKELENCVVAKYKSSYDFVTSQYFISNFNINIL